MTALNKTWDEEKTVQSRFEQRSRIRKFGCKYLPTIANLMERIYNVFKVREAAEKKWRKVPVFSP